MCSWLVLRTDAAIPLAHIYVLFSLLLVVEVRRKALKISEGDSYGIALFGLAMALSIYDGIDSELIFVAGIVLTFSDALAGIVGRQLPIIKLKPLSEDKSLLGICVFFLTTGVILSIQPYVNLTFIQLISISIIATLCEAFSWKGSDNFMVIIGVVIGLAFM